jgi:transposase
MEALRECCAGLDVHQKTIVACILKGNLEEKPRPYIQTFGTTTKELLGLQDWLMENGCEEVAMESTGVLWKPVWNVLESTCNLVLANARQIKNMPGRKTDKKDAQWIAQLHRCGLIEPSVVLPVHLRDLRDWTRYRVKMVQAAAAEKNRIHKVLQDANIKLSSFVSDIFGVSGRLILQKLMEGEVIDEHELKGIVKTKLKRKVPELVEALNGRLRRHHRVLMSYHWKHLTCLAEQVKQLEIQIDEELEIYRDEIEWLDSIPGIERNAAAAIFAEMGPNIDERFPTEEQFASWAGICPGNKESAGKKAKTKCLQGNKYLKRALTQASWANDKSQNLIGQHFRRIRKRRGDKKACVATGHLILRIIYAMMKNKTAYKEVDVPGRTPTEKTLEYYLKQIQGMGFVVQVSADTAS